MKRIVGIIVCLYVLISGLNVIFSDSLQQVNALELSEELSVSLARKYEYPITHYDAEWYKLPSVIEMRKVTQIPENVLEIISTEELVELVLEYPLLCDINAFSDKGTGYEHLKLQFNGIEELISRQDAYDKLLNKYREFVIPSNRLSSINIDMSSEEINIIIKNETSRNEIYYDANITNSLNILEYMILDVIRLKSIETDEFMEIYFDKAEQKKSTEYYNGNEYELLSYIAQTDTTNFEDYVGGICYASSYSTITVYTPSGNAVSAKYYSELNVPAPYETAGLMAEYNATHISYASTTFNCHSYAWLSKSRTDYQHITLENVAPFCEDSYYNRVSSAAVGDIITYNYSSHSGFITRINVWDSSVPSFDPVTNTTNTVQNYCISKWGEGAMVAHYMRRCPYYTSDSVLRYYRVAQ